MDLPEEIFPGRSDEARVSCLFSEEAVDADTVAFWEHALYAYSLHRSTAAALPSKAAKGQPADFPSASSVSFSCADVMDDFTVHDIIPTSVFKSAEALNKAGSLMKVGELSNYSYSSSNSSSKSTVWEGGRSLLLNSSMWVLNTVTNIVGSSGNTSNGSGDGASNNLSAINEGYVSVKMFGEIENLISTFISNEANEFDCDDNNPHYVGSCYYKDYDPNVSYKKFSFIGLLNSLVEKYESKECIIDTSSAQNDRLVGTIRAIKGSPESTLLLQNFMLKRQSAVLTKDCNIIKIKKVAASSSSTSTIGEEEVAKLTISSSICLLEGKLRAVEAEMAAHERRARRCVADGNRALAAQQLQLKKIKAQSKETLSGYLVSLVTSQQQLQTSAITAVVKDAILSTTSGLRAIRLGASLTADGAADVMDDLAEEMDVQREVGAALGAMSGVDQSDEELLGELSDLMGAASISAKETAAPTKESSYDPSRVLSLLQSEPLPAKKEDACGQKKMLAI